MQLGAGLVRVVHPAHAAAELEPELGVVAQRLHDGRPGGAVDVEGDLATVHDHATERR